MSVNLVLRYRKKTVRRQYYAECMSAQSEVGHHIFHISYSIPLFHNTSGCKSTSQSDSDIVNVSQNCTFIVIFISHMNHMYRMLRLIYILIYITVYIN